MRKLSFVLVGLILLTSVSCTNKVTGDKNSTGKTTKVENSARKVTDLEKITEKTGEDKKTAEDYIKSQGYKIISCHTEYEYTLDKSVLYGSSKSISYLEQWEVQKDKPDKYFGKEITVYEFMVESRSLEEKFNAKPLVGIMMSDGKVIGGYSFPYEAKLRGGTYSLDGKTPSEVRGLTYQRQMDKLEVKKY